MDGTSKTKESRRKHQIRQPEEGKMSNTEEMEDDEQFEIAEKELEDRLRLINLFIDKANDVMRLEKKEFKEFHKALDGGNLEIENKVIEGVKCLEAKKISYNDQLSVFSEGIDELLELPTESGIIEKFRKSIRYSLPNNKRRKGDLKFMTKYTASIIFSLESAIENRRDMLEAELYFSKYRSLVKSI